MREISRQKVLVADTRSAPFTDGALFDAAVRKMVCKEISRALALRSGGVSISIAGHLYGIDELVANNFSAWHKIVDELECQRASTVLPRSGRFEGGFFCMPVVVSEGGETFSSTSSNLPISSPVGLGDLLLANRLSESLRQKLEGAFSVGINRLALVDVPDVLAIPTAFSPFQATALAAITAVFERRAFHARVSGGVHLWYQPARMGAILLVLSPPPLTAATSSGEVEKFTQAVGELHKLLTQIYRVPCMFVRARFENLASMDERQIREAVVRSGVLSQFQPSTMRKRQLTLRRFCHPDGRPRVLELGYESASSGFSVCERHIVLDQKSYLRLLDEMTGRIERLALDHTLECGA